MMAASKTLSSVLVSFTILSCLSLYAKATEYQDCGSAGQVLSVDLTGCDLPPCIVARPNNYSIGITFVAAKDAQSLDTQLMVTVSSSEQVPWPAPSACGLMGDKTCPITEGETYAYVLTMQVRPEYPQIAVLVATSLVDEDGVVHACVELPITVV
ncbi:NPC intracellular cholesterol transporter 2 homolog a [Hyalella azteca]|uniref:NPC intracellular cholesterol transporter 2 homolog a n=1 Tax=Hyalella azteca TaxID=294128 RepID=A0A8B7P2P1_HYAAZ|nr:NPC intracellular cholesterol transporter 2 homolog a [Hyalella azteca]